MLMSKGTAQRRSRCPLPHMLKQKSGHIINIASVIGIKAFRTLAGRSTALRRAAIRMFDRRAAYGTPLTKHPLYDYLAWRCLLLVRGRDAARGKRPERICGSSIIVWRSCRLDRKRNRPMPSNSRSEVENRRSRHPATAQDF